MSVKIRLAQAYIIICSLNYSAMKLSDFLASNFSVFPENKAYKKIPWDKPLTKEQFSIVAEHLFNLKSLEDKLGVLNPFGGTAMGTKMEKDFINLRFQDLERRVETGGVTKIEALSTLYEIKQRNAPPGLLKCKDYGATIGNYLFLVIEIGLPLIIEDSLPKIIREKDGTTAIGLLAIAGSFIVGMNSALKACNLSELALVSSYKNLQKADNWKQRLEKEQAEKENTLNTNLAL